VTAVAFDPAGARVVIAARDATLLVSNMDGGVERVLNGATGTINRLQVGRLGDVLAVTSEGRSTIWPAGRSEPIGLEKAGTVLAASFNRDGTQVLTGSEEKFAQIWSRTGQVLFGLVMHDKRVNAVAFSPDGSFVATASSDNTATLWSARGVPYKVLSGHSAAINDVAISPDSGRVATASGDGTIGLWDRDGHRVATLRGHTNIVGSVAFSPDGQWILSSSLDSSVRLWARDGTPMERLRRQASASSQDDDPLLLAPGPSFARFSPDGRQLMTSLQQGNVELWPMGREDFVARVREFATPCLDVGGRRYVFPEESEDESREAVRRCQQAAAASSPR
jgi:WD40 repeat protein